MKAICAWCKRDGHAGLLGDREPLDDPAETHGICPHHRAQLLREYYGRSPGGVRLLFVIAPNEQKLYDYLSRSFAGLSNVDVIMERRRHDRRRETQGCATERRATERRTIRGERYALGYQTFRFTDDPERAAVAEAGRH